MSEVAVKVEGLSKLYRLGQYTSYKTLRDSIANALLVPFRRFSSNGKADDTESDSFIWALKDVSFQVQQGEVLGIIGPNGAGKSTLLKVLSRITPPTEGRIETQGRVASLLEVGTGFHAELTGRENIYLNGAILGMKRSEVNRKFDEIVAFSGVERFIDTPVKRYSSGMFVRLAFSVAAHLDPDILIVDEVLAVGDVAFREKCLGKMDQVADSGRTVLLVSHNMGAIKSLAGRAIWLESGRIREMGESGAVVNNYLSAAKVDDRNGFFDSTCLESRRVQLEKYAGHLRLSSVRTKDGNNRTSGVHLEGSDILLEIEFSADTPVEMLEVFVRVRTTEGQLIFTCLPGRKDIQISPGTYRAIVGFNPSPLLPGTYRGDIVLLSNIPEDNVSPAFVFEIIPNPTQVAGALLTHPLHTTDPGSAQSSFGLIRVKAAWEDVYMVETHLNCRNEHSENSPSETIRRK